MARGYVWALYVDDSGQQYATKVDADYAEMPERGWVAIDPATVPQIPRGWLLRAVVGVDEEGRRQIARVATVAADLWTGVAPTFVVNATDEQQHTATVIARMSEHRIPSTSTT